MKGMANVFQPQFPFKGVVAAMANLVRGNAFSPASLFAANEPGVWYDPSDFSTLYQDAAGTTPVTAVEQPVGLMLDKSKGLVLGPELVTNGTFESDINGWIASPTYPSSTAVEWSNGALHVYNTQANYGESRSAAIPLTIGKQYVLEMDILEGTTDRYWIIIGSSASNDNDGRITVTSESSGTSPSGYKRWRYQFVAAYATAYLYFATNKLAGSHLYADNISVRELPGNHAFQTTATSRPVLSARYNLLTRTEQFDDAIWAKTNVTVTPNATNAPDGTLTAYKLIETTATGEHRTANASAAVVSGVSYTYTVFVKAEERTFAAISGISTYWGAGKQIIYDLVNLTATSAFGVIATISDEGEGWRKLTWTAAAISTAGPTATVSPNLFVALNNSTVSYTGDGTSGIYIWGASLVPADQAHLPYQRVNTATDYDTAGFPHYLRFDGIDDWLVTPTITPGIDKVQVFAGVRKLSDAARGMVAELSATTANSGSFGLEGPGFGAGATYGWTSKGTLNGTVTPTGFSAPITNVLTGLGNIAGDTATLRVNGTQAAISTGDQGTGNYLAYPLYIGRRAGTQYPFNGHLYGLLVRFGANLPIETIEKTEKYINTKTRAY